MAARKRHSIQDIARQVGVAKSTVSRVINGGYASDEIAARVNKVIHQTGYAPSSAAQHLSKGRQGVIGMAIDSFAGAWISEILEGIEGECTPLGASMLLGTMPSEWDPHTVTVEGWIKSRRVDGLILIRPTVRHRALVDLAAKTGMPLAILAPDYNFKKGRVWQMDNRRAGRILAEHLLSLGHRRFAYLAGRNDSVDSKHRLEGLRQALDSRSLSLPDAQVTAGGYRSEDGLAFAHQWLKQAKSRRATALVAANDEMALGLQRGLQQAGVAVPKEVSIAGFDDLKASSLAWPGLTSVRQPLTDMTRQAAAFLLEAGDFKEPARMEKEASLEMELVIRESTGPAKS